MAGTLYLIATPIGNLQDISQRAVAILAAVDLIAAEDTRHTQKLLNHLKISTRTISFHDHNENERAAELLQRLASGESIGVVSDAGTPGISDPGSQLVRLCIEAGITVVPVPGPVAFVSAVVASGLPTDSIFFDGFLPSKSGDRRRRLEEVRAVPATLVFYESPHRLARSLIDCLEILGDRRAAVARELTKLHEEVLTGDLSGLAARYSNGVRGEIVIVIDRLRTELQALPEGGLKQRVQELEQDGLDRKQALKEAAKEFGISRSEAYRMLI